MCLYGTPFLLHENIKKELIGLKLAKEDIAVIRALFGYTRKQVAFLCDVSPGYITLVEQGKRPISKKLEHNMIARFKLDEEILIRIKFLATEFKRLQDK